MKMVSHFPGGFVAERDIQRGSGNGGCGFHNVAVAIVRFFNHRFGAGFRPGGDFIHLPRPCCAPHRESKVPVMLCIQL
jgi:hypothetical protein